MGGLHFALLCATFHLEISVGVKIRAVPTLVQYLIPGLSSRYLYPVPDVDPQFDKCVKIASSCKGVF